MGEQAFPCFFHCHGGFALQVLLQLIDHVLWLFHPSSDQGFLFVTEFLEGLVDWHADSFVSLANVIDSGVLLLS